MYRRMCSCVSLLEDDGMNMTVVDNKTMELQMLTINRDLERAFNLNGEQLSEVKLGLISMMLYEKDRYMSGSAYHEWQHFVSVCPDITA